MRADWQGYGEDIERWVHGCVQCQKRNTPPTPPAPLNPIHTNFPFEKVAWDIMGPLPETSLGNFGCY